MDDPKNLEAPEEWVISRVCEEFHCLPDQAMEAIDNDIGGLIFKIIDLRAYAKAKAQWERDQKEEDPSRRASGPHIDRVIEIDFAIAQEKFDEAKRKNGS